MLKFALISVVGAAIFAAAGFFAEPYLFRPPPPTSPSEVDGGKPAEVLYKMPLGKFTLQVVQRKRSVHLLFDIDVYMAGSANFEKMNGAMGRAELRDTTIREIAEMAETALWANTEDLETLDKRFLAEEIVRQLYLTYPMVRTARVNQLTASVSVRE